MLSKTCAGNLHHGQHRGGAALPRFWARSNITLTYPSVPLGCSQVCGKHFLGWQLWLPWARLLLAASEVLRALCLESSRAKELIKSWSPFLSYLEWWESQAKGCNSSSRGAGEEPRWAFKGLMSWHWLAFENPEHLHWSPEDQNPFTGLEPNTCSIKPHFISSK